MFFSPAGVVKGPPTDEELAAEIERRRLEAREAKRQLEQTSPGGADDEVSFFDDDVDAMAPFFEGASMHR